jgi:hypothetical protein
MSLSETCHSSQWGLHGSQCVLHGSQCAMFVFNFIAKSCYSKIEN